MSRRSGIYSSPFRVYLAIGALALAGVICGLKLPISLFPNSTKPEISVQIPYGNLTPEEFLNTYGRDIEALLRQATVGRSEVEKLTASYQRREVEYQLLFTWGSDPKAAENEVSNRANAFAARLPEEAREGMKVRLDDENSGFFAASFFSSQRTLDSLHELLEPILLPKVSHIKDASQPELYNPTRKEIRIDLHPEVLASLRILPSDIDRALSMVLRSYAGGSVAADTRQYFIEMPRLPMKIDDLEKIPIQAGTGKWVHLSDIAKIDFGPKTTDGRSFKTNGAASLILFATPRPGGNVKRMSEEIRRAIEELKPSLPKDVEYRVLVDPSEFIRSAINNVFHEVMLAALLAVIVLFLFIGSLRNVITAAIEIPLSMVLAFILMRLFGINLNLISLGGLALSAGMNVDASVVVMENIFRKFEGITGTPTWKERVRLVGAAVREVRFAVIASTIASLVVFLPLVFTSGLSFAILGDLAMAVVFSHGFSAAVALILVPTIRLQLMESGGHTTTPHLERQIQQLESGYARLLGRFIADNRTKAIAFAALPVLLAAVLYGILPRLPKEIVAIPDTDWIFLNIKTQGNTLLRQMEVTTEEIEGEVLKELGEKIQYTFTQVNGLNSATIMSRLKSKGDMNAVWDRMERRFRNTPFVKFRVGPWNPSELPIPDPPHLRLSVRGPDAAVRAELTREISDLLQENNLYPRLWTTPNVDADASLRIEPHLDQWEALTKANPQLSPAEIADIARIATVGRRSGYFPWRNKMVPVMLRFPRDYVEAPEDLGALPIGVGNRIVPLKSLAQVSLVRGVPTIYRENDQELNLVETKLNRSEEGRALAISQQAERLISRWREEHAQALAEGNITIALEDPNEDLTDAIHQLQIAVGLSILLIFLVLMFQFGSVAESLLVLVAIPLGFLGVMISLFVFRSTLSLNSILGVILLNGISVANSILLVDFTKRLFAEGYSARAAAVRAAQLRLRPILITSLTTILGMLPIAIGMGEGGRILQPLGIAVSGGLWVSMLLTLFFVPALHVWTLEHPGLRDLLRSVGKGFRQIPWRTAATTSAIALTLLSASPTGAAPEPPAPAPLKFSEAIQKILERSTAIGTARENLEALEAANLPARLVFLPSLSINGYRREARDYLALDKDLSHGLELSSSINLMRFGADIAGIRAANHQEEALEHSLDQAWLTTEDDAVRALVNLIQVSQEVRIFDEISDAFLRSLEIARERYRQGLLPSQEVDKVLIDFENSTASLRDAEIRFKSAKARLTALLGHDGVLLEWPWKERFTDSLPEFGITLSKRPDWLAAESRLRGAEATAEQALGRVFPSVDLGVAYGYIKQDTLNKEGDYWAARLTLTIPLFDRLSNFSDYRAKVHTKMASEFALEQVKRTAHQEWEAAKSAFSIALETAKTRENTLQTARNLYRDNIRKFHRGLTSANDLIVDQNRAANAELFAARGWGQVHINFMETCHAVGKRLVECGPDAK